MYKLILFASKITYTYTHVTRKLSNEFHDCLWVLESTIIGYLFTTINPRLILKF